MKPTNLQRQEWDQWRLICGLLLNSKAVTNADLSARVGSNLTDGQKLLTALREWGTLRFEQGLEVNYGPNNIKGAFKL